MVTDLVERMKKQRKKKGNLRRIPEERERNVTEERERCDGAKSTEPEPEGVKLCGDGL